jgi:hypothetical protein
LRDFGPGSAAATTAACGVRCSRCGQSVDSCCWPHQIPPARDCAGIHHKSLDSGGSLPFPQILGCRSRSAWNCSGRADGPKWSICLGLYRRLPRRAPKRGRSCAQLALIRRAQHLAILSTERLVRSRLFCRVGQSVPEEEATKLRRVPNAAHGGAAVVSPTRRSSSDCPCGLLARLSSPSHRPLGRCAAGDKRGGNSMVLREMRCARTRAHPVSSNGGGNSLASPDGWLLLTSWSLVEPVSGVGFGWRSDRNGRQDRTSESYGLSGTTHDNPVAWELGTFESHVVDIEPEVLDGTFRRLVFWSTMRQNATLQRREPAMPLIRASQNPNAQLNRGARLRFHQPMAMRKVP